MDKPNIKTKVKTHNRDTKKIVGILINTSILLFDTIKTKKEDNNVIKKAGIINDFKYSEYVKGL